MKYKNIMMTAAGFLGIAVLVAACAQQGIPTGGDLKSGYFYSMPETQAMQWDTEANDWADIDNPGFIWVDQGEELWDKVDGKAGKSCAGCHGDVSSMAGVSTTYPKYNAADGKLRALQDQITDCRVNRMQAKEWKWESDEMLGMTAFIKLQSRGMPINVAIDGSAAPFYQAGKEFYEARRGMMDMSCANCHEDYPGSWARADLISNGLPNGYPTFRLKWQKFGSLHRRFSGCNKNIRAQPYGRGSDEYTNLELYIASRANGVASEAPGVRR